jgi:capsular exopolysaccharide synthesis family protein
MDLRSYVRAIRKRWWLVLIVAVLGGAGGELMNVRATPLYASHVTFYVSSPGAVGTAAAQAEQSAQRRTNSYVELLSSDKLAKTIIADTGLKMSPGLVTREIKGSAEVNTVLLKASVTDPSPARALRIATSIANQFPIMIDRLDNIAATKTVTLNVVSGPSVGHFPVSPRKKLNITIAVMIGLLAGLVLAVLRELTDTTIRSAEMLRDVVGLPLLGSIHFDNSARKAPLIVGGQVRSLRAEAFRHVRTNLQFVDVDHPIKLIVVTSSIAGEGKSTTATNLAIVFAETGSRVLLIEADLRRPRVSDYLGLERAVGLTNVLAGQVAIDEVLQNWGADGLTVLPCGSIPPNPSELLGSQNMVDLLSAMRERFDTIIIDTPPLLPVTDAAVASVLADGVVVVVRYGRTNRAQLAAAVRSLESVDARVLGCVLTMQPAKQAEGRGRYDGYGYYEDAPPKKPAIDVSDLLETEATAKSSDGQRRDDAKEKPKPKDQPTEQDAQGDRAGDKTDNADQQTTQPHSGLGDAEGWQAIHVTKTRGSRGTS